MAYGLNQITISGAITTEPVISKTRTDRTMMRFTISGITKAVDRYGHTQYTDDGDPVLVTHYRHITLFGAHADHLINRGAAIGTPVIITGMLNQRQWTDQHGNKRTDISVRADTVHVLDFAATPGRVEDLYELDRRDNFRLNNAINSVQLIGNLVEEADIKQTRESNIELLPLRIAVNTRYRDGKGEYQDTTLFIGITAWRDLAVELQALPKGTQVFVNGTFQSRSWTNTNGERVFQDYVDAYNIDVVQLPKTTTDAPNQRATPQQKHPASAPAAPSSPAAAPSAPTAPQEPQRTPAPPAAQTPTAGAAGATPDRFVIPTHEAPETSTEPQSSEPEEKPTYISREEQLF